MKTYKIVTAERKIIDKEFCDWCGKEIDYLHDETFEDFTLEYESKYCAWGDSWTNPESWKVDLCKVCAEKVKQFLLSNNVILQQEE